MKTSEFSEPTEPPLRNAEVIEEAKGWAYRFYPPLSKGEFEANPKYQEIVSFVNKSFRGEGGFVLMATAHIDGGGGETYVGLNVPKTASFETVNTLFQYLRTAGIADIKITQENYPPEFKFEKKSDPGRKYGFIAGSDGKVQNYSYLSVQEKERKSNYLINHPNRSTPPGDPCDAPDDAKFGFAITSVGGSEPVRETYWYRTEDERQEALKLING